MPIGPGKYDDLCTYIREKAEARGAIVIIVEGNKGEGFAVQADIITMIKLPDMLEAIAKQMRDATSV